MVTRRTISTWKLSWILLLNVLHSSVEAGPAKRSGRTAREVYPEIEPENESNQAQVCIVGDVVYAVDEPVPAEQPCLKCRCQPPGVQCETIKCVKKSGCKAIHRPNKCCPEYQCECHHEGKVYANGERLKSPPEGECKVCYCRGGEVQCAEVSCYIRTDCEGKTVPGQCCPKYDHCPPKEPIPGRPRIDPSLVLWPRMPNSSDESTNKIESATFNTAKSTEYKQIEQPKITIHEIIPEIKEIPMTSPTKELESNNDVVTDPEPDSSEISEVFQQPPPVLRIGDKLLFLSQGELVPEKDTSTPASVITIIGAEGLQQGFEDSAEHHEVDGGNNLFNNSNDLEPKTSESTHILSLVKHKKRKNDDFITAATSEESTSVNVSEISSPEPTRILVLEEAVNKTDVAVETTTKTFQEENPAYPAIQEIPSPHKELELVLNITEEEKNATEQTRTTTESEDYTTTEETTTEFTTNSSTEYERSMESIEETTEDSGENTTPKNDHAPMVSNENASVELSETLESVDMLKESSPTPDLQIDDVEMIQNKTEEVTPEVSKDVEMINFDNITRTETNVKTEKIAFPVKVIEKREADEVFKELDAELNVDNTERSQTVEEEKEESEKIFQELLEETSTPRSAKKGDRNDETLQRVTDTIARLTLRRKNSFDNTNILGVISNFFGSQSRFNGKK